MMWTAADAPNLMLAEGVAVPDDVRFGANVTVHEGTVIGAGCAIVSIARSGDGS